MAKKFKMYLGGEWVDREEKIRVVNPYDNKLVATVPSASKKDYTRAITLAHKAFAETRELPSYRREAILRAIADGIEKDIEKFTRMMCLELGKAYRDARGEVTRSI
ncbi:MAG: aldehyde dehydrogenase family protein, partial [candidate division Zixibacteria bacterium]|nr:aldehyde dehydrogenase family protein [candidate division Zixibacteria bacterium]